MPLAKGQMHVSLSTAKSSNGWRIHNADRISGGKNTGWSPESFRNGWKKSCGYLWDTEPT